MRIALQSQTSGATAQLPIPLVGFGALYSTTNPLPRPMRNPFDGRSRLLQVALALVAFGTSGCYTWAKVGLSEEEIRVRGRVPMTCIEDRGGGAGSVVLGTVDGHPAVQPSGIRLGVTPVMDQPVKVDGADVFAAQECLDGDIAVCDTSLYLRRGDFHYFLYWSAVYPSGGMPKTTRALVADMRKRGLVDVLLELELDDETIAATAKMAEERSSRRTWEWVKFAGGALVQKSLPKLGVLKDAADDASREWMSEAVKIEFRLHKTEVAELEQNPKLAAVFAAAQLATGKSATKVASVCVGPAGGAR